MAVSLSKPPVLITDQLLLSLACPSPWKAPYIKRQNHGTINRKRGQRKPRFRAAKTKSMSQPKRPVPKASSKNTGHIKDTGHRVICCVATRLCPHLLPNGIEGVCLLHNKRSEPSVPIPSRIPSYACCIPTSYAYAVDPKSCNHSSENDMCITPSMISFRFF